MDTRGFSQSVKPAIPWYGGAEVFGDQRPERFPPNCAAAVDNLQQTRATGGISLLLSAGTGALKREVDKPLRVARKRNTTLIKWGYVFGEKKKGCVRIHHHLSLRSGSGENGFRVGSRWGESDSKSLMRLKERSNSRG